MEKMTLLNAQKQKKLLKVVDIVKIKGVKKKKYLCDYCPKCEFKPEMHITTQKNFL